MVTLEVYFEYTKILCKIFTKYIMPILQVYQSSFIILKFIIYYFILFIYLINNKI